MVRLAFLGVGSFGRGLGWEREGVNGVSLGDLGSAIIQLFKLWLVLCNINTENLITL